MSTWGGREEMNPFIRFFTPSMLFLAALAVRLFSWHSVFQDGGVFPNGNDAYYHLRRIRYSVDHFPEVLRLDPLMNFPAGGESIWPPTFDWLIAALLRGLPAFDGLDQIERVVVWIPPILGAATIVIVYFIGLRFFSRVVAVVAAAVMAILPAHSIYSRLGSIDHHVLVAMIIATMLALAMALFRADKGDAADRTRLRLSVGLGLAFAVAVLVWPGSLLHIGVLQIAIVVRLLTAPDAESAKVWALRFSVVHLVAGLAVLPMSAGNDWEIWGSFSPVVLSNFQPVYFFAAFMCFALPGTMWRRGWADATPRSRMVSAGLAGGALLLALLALIPELRMAISESLSWFAKNEEFQSAVNESVPLFGGGRGLARAGAFLSNFVYAVPVAIVYYGWQFRHRPEKLLFVGWALALYLVTLVQWRFMNSYSIAHSLLIGLTVESLFGAVAPSLTSRTRKLVVATLAIGLIAAVFAPSVKSYRMHLVNFARSLRNEATFPISAQLKARLVVDAARFLRDHSPAGKGPYGEADYSVLAPWGDGHILKAIGERAVVQDNFGDDVAPENFRRAEAYFAATSESDALEILSPIRTRYVLVRSTGSGHHLQVYEYNSLFTRLYTLSGSRGTVSRAKDGESRVMAALRRHRLIYQSRPLDDKGEKPFVMLFEIVEGARLVGKSIPGSIVQVKLDLASTNGPREPYTAATKTDSNGVYRLRLPYSTAFANSNVETGPHYDVRWAALTKRVAVSESAVMKGTRVEGPSLVH